MIEFLQDCWHGLYKVLNTIACSFDHQSSNRKARRILLILKVLVHVQKDIKPRCGERQKFSVTARGLELAIWSEPHIAVHFQLALWSVGAEADVAIGPGRERPGLTGPQRDRNAGAAEQQQFSGCECSAAVRHSHITFALASRIEIHSGGETVWAGRFQPRWRIVGARANMQLRDRAARADTDVARVVH